MTKKHNDNDEPISMSLDQICELIAKITALQILTAHLFVRSFANEPTSKFLREIEVIREDALKKASQWGVGNLSSYIPNEVESLLSVVKTLRTERRDI